MICSVISYILFRWHFYLENYEWTLADRCFNILVSTFGGPVGIFFALLFLASVMKFDKKVKW